MSHFEMDGAQYRIARLNTFQQLGLSRRIAPLIPPLIPVFVKMQRSGGIGKDLAGLGELLQPFADGLAGLPDEAIEYVVNVCMSALSREVTEGTWAKIWIQSTKSSQFDELNDLSKTIPLVVRVIQESLGNFIRGLLIAQQAEPQEATQ
jgi:hypothetical protein